MEEANHLLAAIHRTQLPSSVPLLQYVPLFIHSKENFPCGFYWYCYFSWAASHFLRNGFDCLYRYDIYINNCILYTNVLKFAFISFKIPYICLFNNQSVIKDFFSVESINIKWHYRQQGRDASESRMVLKLKREQQQQVLLSLISEVAQLESTRTICGNYQLKCQRQEYFLQKQKIVSFF